MDEQAQRNAFSKLIVEALGTERLDNLLPQQDRLLGVGLERIFQRHQGNVAAITPDEILGQYELVTEEIFPHSLGPLLKQLRA
jgi:hypothetical protein